MKSTEAIKAIMEAENTKPSDLAYKLGIGRSTLSERFRQNSLTVAKLNEMLRVMGYKVVVVPRTTSVPSDGYVLED